MATPPMLKGVDFMLTSQITREKSEKSFGRYIDRALQFEAEQHFYEAFWEGGLGQSFEEQHVGALHYDP